MGGRLRSLVRTLALALLGAVVGRVLSDLRTRGRDGSEPSLDVSSLGIRPHHVVPGLVAAMRAREWPWALFHVPPWLAAFAVNIAVGAFARELAPALRLAGIPMDEDEDDEEPPMREVNAQWSSLEQQGAASPPAAYPPATGSPDVPGGPA